MYIDIYMHIYPPPTHTYLHTYTHTHVYICTHEACWQGVHAALPDVLAKDPGAHGRHACAPELEALYVPGTHFWRKNGKTQQ